MAPIKVYGLAMSTCTMRILCTLHEKEIHDYELIPINVGAGEHKAPSFLAKQPFGQVPALEDGDFSLFESRAMSRYVCNKFPNQGTDLLGSTLEEKAKVDNWLEVESHNYNGPISAVVYEKVFTKMYGRQENEERAKEQLEKLGKVLDVYEQVLAKQPYLAGEKFSLADLSHLAYTHYLVNMAHVPIFESCPNAKAWWERCTSRPSWQKVVELSKRQ